MIPIGELGRARNIAPGGKNDYLFGGRAAHLQNNGYDQMLKVQRQREANTNKMLGQNNEIYGFGSGNKAFGNRQRINAQGDHLSDAVFNNQMSNAGQNLEGDNTAIRFGNAQSGMSNSSLARNQEESALQRYYQSTAQANVAKESSLRAYGDSMQTNKNNADDLIRQNQDVTNVYDLIGNRTSVKASGDTAYGRAVPNFIGDVSKGFGGGQ